MKIPKSIKVNTQPYKVVVKDLDDCYGLTDSEATTIELDAAMSHHRAELTLLHECLHALFAETAIGYTLERKKVDEETLVRELAAPLLDVIHQLYTCSKP